MPRWLRALSVLQRTQAQFPGHGDSQPFITLVPGYPVLSLVSWAPGGCGAQIHVCTHIKALQSGKVAHASNPACRGTKKGLFPEFEASQGYTDKHPVLKKPKINQ